MWCFTYTQAWYLFQDEDIDGGLSGSDPVLVKSVFQRRVTVGSAQIAGGGRPEDELPLPSAKGGKRKRVGKIVGIL